MCEDGANRGRLKAGGHGNDDSMRGCPSRNGDALPDESENLQLHPTSIFKTVHICTCATALTHSYENQDAELLPCVIPFVSSPFFFPVP